MQFALLIDHSPEEFAMRKSDLCSETACLHRAGSELIVCSRAQTDGADPCKSHFP
jgi:hypothetical protein